MKIATILSAVGAVLVFGTAPSLASPSPTGTPRAPTPDSCIRMNHGDYNACNVGNSGRGDRPYRPVKVDTPNACVKRNHGDYNACNVGNSGRGDLPYRPVVH
jgi:hypothetical protein